MSIKKLLNRLVPGLFTSEKEVENYCCDKDGLVPDPDNEGKLNKKSHTGSSASSSKKTSDHKSS